jgi:hypothetical protein
VARRVRSMENSNDLIGNQTRDLPACNIVPQPTMLPHASNEDTKGTFFLQRLT